MNSEERQLAEMLHRVTPEPPRRVTVEDVAFRVASEVGRSPRRGPRLSTRRRGRGWVPALAAASVFAVAGLSAGIATVMTSHHGPSSPSDGTPTTTAPPQNASTSSSATVSSPPATAPAGTPLRVAGGMWGAELVNRQSFTQDTLVSSGDSLYAVTGNALVRIDPATGDIVRSVPYQPPVPGRPVVVGNTVWVVSAYSGGNVVLRGYDARTLAQVASVPVPAIGGVPGTAAGVLASGPGGRLYVAAGDTVAIVNPASGQVSQRIYLTAGTASSSVAVSPDGSRLYIGITPSAGTLQVLTYDLGIDRIVGSSRMTAGGAGNLLATSGGVWGTAGTGMSEWAWFAPHGNLSSAVRVGQGASGGLSSMAAASGGAVWIGGTHALACASPVTGQVLASAAIPADNGAAEYFGSVAVLASGHAYALYQDQAAHLSGVASLTPPAACRG